MKINKKGMKRSILKNKNTYHKKEKHCREQTATEETMAQKVGKKEEKKGKGGTIVLYQTKATVNLKRQNSDSC